MAAVLATVVSSEGAQGKIVSKIETGEKVVALTFDDGPHPRTTAEILDVLKDYGVRATFFNVGENAVKRPELTAREVAEGHEVGNHTFTHINVKSLSAEKLKEQLIDTEDAITEAAGVKPTLFRPPEGKIGKEGESAAEELGYTVVLWSVDTRDWTHRTARAIAETVEDNVNDGDVILCHDFISGESHTAEALRIFIPKLLEEGYEFVTVSELISKKAP
ncbi:MAG: polysaccharide deacetylase family protein [Clostridia bacterium]|nr:polysaccharide deacetylase family protein [Clostridia bacterium]